MIDCEVINLVGLGIVGDVELVFVIVSVGLLCGEEIRVGVYLVFYLKEGVFVILVVVF